MSSMCLDISHLTEQERLIIEGVLERQRLEEQKEQEYIRQKQDEVHSLERRVSQTLSLQPYPSSTCHICGTVRFLDGIGYLCHYCHIRSCAVCGGKVSLRSGKVIWVCILCRKRQELLVRSGEWLRNGTTQHSGSQFRKLLLSASAHKFVNSSHHTVANQRQSESRARRFLMPSWRRALIGSVGRELRPYSVSRDRQTLADSSSTSLQDSASLDCDAVDNNISADNGLLYSPLFAAERANRRHRLRHIGASSHSVVRARDPSAAVSAAALGGARVTCEDSCSSSEGDEDCVISTGETTTSCGDAEEIESLDSLSEKDYMFKWKDRNSMSRFDVENPVVWQPSPDGQSMLGHMILDKHACDGFPHHHAPARSSSLRHHQLQRGLIGLKVVGGRRFPHDGHIGAVVERVKYGSVADIVAKLRPGDEIIEWNGHVLHSLSARNVSDIIESCKHDNQVDLRVRRQNLGNRSLNRARSFQRLDKHRSRSFEHVYASSHSLESQSTRHAFSHKPVAILQIKLWYDSRALRFQVTIVSAYDIVLKFSHHHSVFVRVLLLPDKFDKFRMCTHPVPLNLRQATWHECLVHSPLQRADLRARIMHLSLWSTAARTDTCCHLVGECALSLAERSFTDVLETHQLMSCDLPANRSFEDSGAYLTPDRLSPRSTGSYRSDTRECSVDSDPYASAGTVTSHYVTPGRHRSGASSCRVQTAAAAMSRSASMSRPAAANTVQYSSDHAQNEISLEQDMTCSSNASSSLSRYSGQLTHDGDHITQSRLAGRRLPSLQSRSDSLNTSPSSSPRRRQLPATPTTPSHTEVEKRSRQLLWLQQQQRHHNDNFCSSSTHLSATGTQQQPSFMQHQGSTESEPVRVSAYSPPHRYHQQRRYQPFLGAATRGRYEMLEDSDLDSVDSARSIQSERLSGRRNRCSQKSWQHVTPTLTTVDQSNCPQSRHYHGNHIDAPIAMREFAHAQRHAAVDSPQMVPRHTANGTPHQLSARQYAPDHYSSVPDMGQIQEYSHAPDTHRQPRATASSGKGGAMLTAATEKVAAVTNGRMQRRVVSTSARDQAPAEGEKTRTAAAATTISATNQNHMSRSEPVISVVCAPAADTQAVPKQNSEEANAFQEDDLFDLSDFGVASDEPTASRADQPKKSGTKEAATRTAQQASDRKPPTAPSGELQAPGSALKNTLAPTGQQLSQLSNTGYKKRLKFGTVKERSTFRVNRSEEVLPSHTTLAAGGGSHGSREFCDGDLCVSEHSETSSVSSACRPIQISQQQPAFHDDIMDFVDQLGPGQLMSRQMLVCAAVGEIQICMRDRDGHLEVEIVRARGLQQKQSSRLEPASYVKICLKNGKRCLAKAKTITAARTLDPIYQQILLFTEQYNNCFLQVSIWGDYGRIEGKKVFMGAAQIVLDELDLSKMNVAWYRLFLSKDLCDKVSGGVPVGNTTSAASDTISME